MASLLTPRRDCHVCSLGDGVCRGEVIVVTTSLTREIFVRCAPVCPSGSAAEQAEKFYACLPQMLEQGGATMQDVVLERVFFRDILTDFEMLTNVRSEAYRAAGIADDQMPAPSYINQPPCKPEQALEFQIQALLPNGDGRLQVESRPVTPQGAATKIVTIGDYRHLYITNINGMDDQAVLPKNFRQQSDNMFQRSLELLKLHDTTFPDVLRTWCYLDDIDRDYDEFNLSRNEFFDREKVMRLPASTGIRAGLYPAGSGCSFDLYSLLNPEGAQIEVMHTPTLNEADEYGSAFSRGMKVVLPEKTVLYISGTASVDEQGATVHLDDERKQIERMLLNVQELLSPHNATFDDLVQVITYLKSASYHSTFVDAWKARGLNDAPNTFVEAGVCRPDLLCEMEAIAIIPT